jgi:hypothetical protein
MELIIIIILLIVIIYLYNQTLIETKKKERYTNNKSQCNRNCGNYNIDTTSTDVAGCLSCGYCGLCTLPNKSQICMNGNEDGAYFNSDCSGNNWNFSSGIINPTGLDFSYESQLTNLGQTDNLPSQVTKVSYDITDESTYNVYSHYHPRRYQQEQTTSALANLLNKINSTNNKNNNIDPKTITQLQQILNQLQNLSN